MYTRCSMQYYFRYIKDLIEPPKLALSAGKAGHSTLEANYRQKIKSGDDLALAELLSKYSDFYDNETAELEAAALEPDESIGKVKDEGIAQLTVYHAKIAPKIRPLLVEWEFNTDLSDPAYEYPLRIANGRIDLVTAALEIYDNKFVTTRRGVKSQADVDLSMQLSLYDMTFEERFKRTPNALGLMVFIPPGKTIATPPEVQVITRDPRLMTRDIRAARHARLIHQLHTVEREIALGIYRPVDDPRVCSWCGYREQCQYSLVRDDFTAMKIRAA